MKRWMLPLFLILVVPASASAGLVRADLSAQWLSGQTLEDGTEVPPADRDLRISLWHDREDDDPYRRGERLAVHFRTNEDLYAVVYKVDADGYVDVLWPTNRYSDGFVYGGHVYTLPPQGSPHALRVSNSKGVEYVEAIASRYPFDLRALGIDFALDPQESGEYRYAVAGDPFLAINDINFAITGLEEDVDYIVTDWVHLYVGETVSHARYSCRQCHTSDETYHPYVDTCTQVTIYRDFGWHTRWRATFSWYPLYCDPPYYYWDRVFYRPYVNYYYPVAYSWPGWRCYTRPYPVYWWHDSPRYAGNHLVRYRRGVSRSGPLWDADRRVRGGTRVPSSVRVADVRRARGPVDESVIVRGSPPARRGDDRKRTVDVRPTGDRGRIVDRTPPAGIRTGTDRGRRDRGQVSLRPMKPRTPAVPGNTPRVGTPRTSPDRGGRSWTRPVIRNADPKRTNPPVVRGNPRTPSRPATPEVRTQPRGSERRPSTVKPPTQRTTPRKPPVVKPRTPSKPKPKPAPRPTVKRREGKKGGGGGTPQISRPAPRRSSPSVQRSAPSRPKPTVKRSAPSRPRPEVKRSAPSRPRPQVKRSAPSPSRSKPSVQRSRPAPSKGGGKATVKRGSSSRAKGKARSKGGGGR